jgi:CDP-diacylglycerol--glycerol-3-phosphate 3-phosphatidyltransferase
VIWNVPNLLSLSRLPLAVVLCAAIAFAAWPLALGVFTVAALTDWLDGWWARRFQQQSLLGRNLDPLTDKVLIGSAFIFLQDAKIGVEAWMVATILGRELLVTGLRGIVEATGAKFGADWFGKLKTVLQCVVLFAIFLQQTLRMDELKLAAEVLLYAALAATIGSGVQYIVKASRILKSPH